MDFLPKGEMMETKRPILLLVEPEDAVRTLLKRRLQYQGFLVLACALGDEALSFLRENDVLAMVSEVEFLGEPSFLKSLISIAKNEGCCPEVVVVTTSQSSLQPESSLLKEVDAIFYKPYEQMTLEELLKSAVLPLMSSFSHRKYTRIETYLPMSLTIEGVGTVEGMMRNIAQGGLFFSLKESFDIKVGDHLVFRIFQTGKPPVKGCGVISWRKPSNDGFGLVFHAECEDNVDLFKLINELKTLRIGNSF